MFIISNVSFSSLKSAYLYINQILGFYEKIKYYTIEIGEGYKIDLYYHKLKVKINSRYKHYVIW